MAVLPDADCEPHVTMFVHGGKNAQFKLKAGIKNIGQISGFEYLKGWDVPPYDKGSGKFTFKKSEGGADEVTVEISDLLGPRNKKLAQADGVYVIRGVDTLLTSVNGTQSESMLVLSSGETDYVVSGIPIQFGEGLAGFELGGKRYVASMERLETKLYDAKSLQPK
jgi:hypothetical protein